MRAEDIESDLDAFEIGDLVPPDEPPPPPEDATGASRLLSVVRRRERDIERVEEIASRRIATIEEWRADRVSGARRSITFVVQSLEVWMRRAFDATGSVTENLPDGELRVRPGKRSMVATDLDAAVRWARLRRRHWIRPKFDIDKNVAKKESNLGPPLTAAAITKAKLDAPPEHHQWRAVVDVDGDVIPGLVFCEPTERVFGYTTDKANDPKQQTMEELR